MRFPLSLRQTALVVLAAAAATVGGALLFEHAFGLLPCKLCLVQRNPYYLAIPIALAAAALPAGAARVALAALAFVFIASAGLGMYHAGVEWGFFAGPSDCGGTPAATPGAIGDFLKQLETARVLSCTEAAWRFLGLSLAGWNAVISLALAAIALGPLLRKSAPRVR
jgi:disulfide bond formation protein DsbB